MGNPDIAQPLSLNYGSDTLRFSKQAIHIYSESFSTCINKETLSTKSQPAQSAKKMQRKCKESAKMMHR